MTTIANATVTPELGSQVFLPPQDQVVSRFKTLSSSDSLSIYIDQLRNTLLVSKGKAKTFWKSAVKTMEGLSQGSFGRMGGEIDPTLRLKNLSVIKQQPPIIPPKDGNSITHSFTLNQIIDQAKSSWTNSAIINECASDAKTREQNKEYNPGQAHIQRIAIHTTLDSISSYSDSRLQGMAGDTAIRSYSEILQKAGYSFKDPIVQQLDRAAAIQSRLEDLYSIRYEAEYYSSSSKMEVYKKGMEELSQAIREEVALMQPGETMMFGGGFVAGWEGHAMYYEVVKQENNQCTFRVYNSGYGHGTHEHYTINGSRKVNTCREVGPFDQSKLTHSLVLQNLMLVNVGLPRLEEVPGKEPKELSAFWSSREAVNYIYELQDSLGSIIPGSIDDAKKEQSSGTCTIEGLHAYVYKHLDRDEYKRLRMFEKVEVVNQLYQYTSEVFKISQSTIEKTTDIGILLRCTHKVEKYLSANGHLLSASEHAKAWATMVKMEDFISRSESFIDMGSWYNRVAWSALFGNPDSGLDVA